MAKTEKMAAQTTMPTSKAGISMNKYSTTTFNLQRRTGPNKAGAFTFVEVIAALSIVAIALVALLKLHIGSLRTTEVTTIITEAAFVAEEKINELLADGFPQLGSDSGTVDKNAASFHWQRNVSDLQLPGFENAKITGLRKISVDVSWNKGLAGRHIQLSTCVADRKLP
jgi:type II secretion system protein I